MTKNKGCYECKKEIKEASYNEGYSQALDDNHILHGDSAVKFLKEMKRVEDVTEEEIQKNLKKIMGDLKNG